MARDGDNRLNYRAPHGRWPSTGFHGWYRKEVHNSAPTITLCEVHSEMTSQERHEARYQRRKAARRAKHRARIAQYDNFDKVADVSSLVDANYNARKGVMWKASVARYNARYFKNSIKIHKTLMRGGDTRRGFYHFGIVERGKKRAIHSLHYSERVVRRSACTNALVPILSSNLIYDNGASLEGKGISFAVKRCAVHLHEFYRETGGNDGYILLIDYRAFFDNINLDNLKHNVIDRHILDQRLNALAKNFVDAPNLERIKYGQPTKENGLYISPEDSQIFAIAYPNSIDHTIKDQWRQRWFARYMDDSYIINKSKELLIEFRRLLFGLFAEKGIIPNPKKTQIVKLRRGFTYLKTKFTLLPNGKVLQQPCRESVIRERRKIKKFFNFLQAGLMTMEQILTSYMSWRGSLFKKQARRSVHCTDLLFYKLYGIMPWKIKSKRKSKARHIQWKNLLNASTPSMPKSPPLKAC